MKSLAVVGGLIFGALIVVMVASIVPPVACPCTARVQRHHVGATNSPWVTTDRP